MTYRIRPADLIVFDGQSLALAPDLTDYASVNNWPYKMMAGLTHTAWAIRAVSATTWLEREVDVAARVDAWLNKCSGTKTLIDIGGTRNINQAMTGADTFAEAAAYWADRRAAGFDHIIAVTMTPSTQYTGGEPAEVAAFNALLLGAVGDELDGCADLDAITDLADPSDTDYYSDGLHYTAAATDLIAPVVLAEYLEVVP